MMTDPVADLLTRIRNATLAGHTKVLIPATRLKANICKVLKEEGFIRSFKIIAKSNIDLNIKVYLKEDALVGLKRVSRPGLRIYRGYDELPHVLSGLGVSVLSTSKGIISSRTAKKLKVGGEVLCSVW